MRKPLPDLAGPSAAELAAIEAETPLIRAELAWLDMELALLDAIDQHRAYEIDWHRLRKQEREVMRQMIALMANQSRPSIPRRVA